MQLTVIQEIVIWALPVLFAITLHEVAHGWVAKQLGDPTAQMLGRITLNPIKHIDPVGTVLVPLLLLVLPGNFLFGWAKPVPITPQNLRNPRRDMAIVALAGPTANFIMALLWAIIARAAVWLDEPFLTNPLVLMGFAGIAINLVLMILNLIPLPPLDGGRIVSNLLPPRTSAKYDLVEPYGFMILVLLLMTGILGGLLSPFFNFFQSLSLSLVGLR